jgi:hypothetical protein
VPARLPPVLALRSLKICWFRAKVDGVIVGRAQLEATWPPPPETKGGWMCAGYPLLFSTATGDDARSLRLLGYLP